jgi:hypothetical protein
MLPRISKEHSDDAFFEWKPRVWFGTGGKVLRKILPPVLPCVDAKPFSGLHTKSRLDTTCQVH